MFILNDNFTLYYVFNTYPSCQDFNVFRQPLQFKPCMHGVACLLTIKNHGDIYLHIVVYVR